MKGALGRPFCNYVAWECCHGFHELISRGMGVVSTPSRASWSLSWTSRRSSWSLLLADGSRRTAPLRGTGWAAPTSYREPFGPPREQKVQKEPKEMSYDDLCWLLESHSGRPGSKKFKKSQKNMSYDDLCWLFFLSGAEKEPQSQKIARTVPRIFWTIRGHYPIKQGFWGKSHQKVHLKVRRNLCRKSSLGYLFCPQFLTPLELFSDWFGHFGPWGQRAPGDTFLSFRGIFEPEWLCNLWGLPWRGNGDQLHAWSSCFDGVDETRVAASICRYAGVRFNRLD